ncbi:hypothetical protein SRHO_G00133370 [Serrasalmus rhombeus]
MCDLASTDMEVLLYSQAMIYTIERINNSSLLPEVKIGYEIYDTCSSVFTALRASLNLMNGESPDQTCLIPNDDVNNTVKAVIGERSSEVSVAVARLLALPLMTQISYASTSELLSSRSKFPSFFRTVPSDKHQTDAIAQLVHKLNFVPVGIIGSEDEYGKNGAESLTDDFKQYNICLEFKIILPADFSQNSTFTELEDTLAKTRAEAIVLFTKETNAMVILKKAIMAGLNRTWIASDAWSTSKDILELEHLSKCGRIYGITCKRNKVSQFNCSKSCNPGFELYTVNPKEPCCKGCKRCEPNFFSNDALFSLLACFISPFFFMGEPTDANCRAGLPLFSLSFTICASCILANLLQISVGFSFKLKLGVWLKRVNQPVIVVLVCVSVQVVICAFWLIKRPPFRTGKNNEDSFILGCNEGSIELFVATQAYIALLCVICFFFAYKGRKLPDLYKNGRFITISMLIYLVVWIIFIPIYIQEHGKNERAIEASAILVSGYGILCCHFAPKCYILLFKKEMNDENVIAEYIRNHYEKKGIRIMS